MDAITGESWRALPDRSAVFAELAAEAISGTEGAFLAVDHEGARHLLVAADSDTELVSDDRSRGVKALTRPLSVQGEPERQFIDVLCTTISGQDVFNLVASAILQQIKHGGNAPDAVRSTLARWRRFWGAAPVGGLTGEEIRGLFGELWFLAFWLLPHGTDQLSHWLGPTGTRHDFQWGSLAVEAKTTTSVRGHVHRINGLDQLDPPADGQLLVFSLRLREEATASNTLVSLVEKITEGLADDSDALDGFEVRLAQAGYSPLEVEHYGDSRFRVLNERLYKVADGFPRLSEASFANGVPDGIERVEYEADLDGCSDLVVATTPTEFRSPPSA
ncbi:MAG TPA: PD-(D/E)XK motif protein [Solirubrobacteraceae bacterium]|jgi:hypothetical protein|nr:PD-(D/E)XK motif protein [Solirubrobacteraceae bacterium]